MRIGMIVEYDGGGFSGSQYQPRARTVQGDLEAAAAKIFSIRSGRVSLASRTDSGVHAKGQVASLDVESELATLQMRNAFNGNLRPDLRVRELEIVADDFNPRRDAVFREYEYVINSDYVASPLLRRVEHHVRSYLDVEAMNRASKLFIGTHDFTAFAAASPDSGTSKTRNVYSAGVVRSATGRIVFTIRANAYVRQQIRRIVAVLIDVGRGAKTDSDVLALLTNRGTMNASQVAPSWGLTLTKIGYGARESCTSLPKQSE